MALERFMVYAEGAPGGRVEVVYCWGFRACLVTAKKIAEWLGASAVVTVDLDTAAEARWFGEAHARACRDYQPGPADPPMSDFISGRPASIEHRLVTAPGDPLLAEVDLRGGLTAWSPVDQF